MECYNPRTNEWTYVAKMNEPHYGHAGTVYGGYMYISGKWLQGGYLSEFVIIQNKDGSIMLWDCLWSLKKKD